MFPYRVIDCDRIDKRGWITRIESRGGNPPINFHISDPSPWGGLMPQNDINGIKRDQASNEINNIKQYQERYI